MSRTQVPGRAAYMGVTAWIDPGAAASRIQRQIRNSRTHRSASVGRAWARTGQHIGKAMAQQGARKGRG